MALRSDSNERLTVLSDVEKTALYGIPSSDDFQRIEFFCHVRGSALPCFAAQAHLETGLLHAANWLLQSQVGIFSVLPGRRAARGCHRPDAAEFS